MLDWLFSLEALGAFLVCFSTLMIFSFLYKDNPYYKFAEHVFVGTSTGYGIVLVWFQIIRPNLLDRLLPPVDAVKQLLFRAGTLAPEQYADYQVSFMERLANGQWVYYVFLVLGILMLFKISRKLHWLSRWPLAYVIGAFAGIQIIQAAQGALVPQLEATMKDFSGKETVTSTLEASGVLPEAEMATRRAAQADWIAAWLEGLAPPARAASAGAAWQQEQERRLNALAGLADPDAPGAGAPQAFKTMRARQAEVLQADADFERLLCDELGGRPLEDALLLAARGESDPAAQLPWMDEATRAALWEAEPLHPACLENLNLAPWQEGLALVATRVWLESAVGRQGLAEACGPFLDLPPAIAAEALAFPAGRTPLVQLLKSEAFPAAAQPDWSLPRTRQLADSLLNEVNPRSTRLADWTPEQMRDLLARLGPERGQLRQELEDRLSVFAALPDSAREAAGTAFLAFWRQGLLLELRDLRQRWLLHTIDLHTAPELAADYSYPQMAAFRQDPAAFLAPHGVHASNGGVRLRMLVELLSNLLVVVGVCAGVFYFFFSKKHTGALGVVSKVGIAFLMMSFGASFGYTVMGRISLAIGRFQDLLAWPWMAGTALVVLVVALAFESRRKPA
jgi:hypothetical protein